MSDSTVDPITTLSSLTASMSSLESALSSLHNRPWPETLESLTTLDRAKMDILLAYAINDLVWVYLKMQGLDPAEHEVTSELNRIKGYYAKIKAIEQPEQSMSFSIFRFLGLKTGCRAERTRTINQASAKRFITASIPSSQRQLPSTSAAGAAQEQARRAVEEQQEQQEQKERVGMASRFRFVNGEAEKVVPGHAENDEEEQEGEEEEEEEEELDVGDDDAAGEGVGDGDWGDAEAFLAGLEDGMMRDGEDVGDDPTDPEPLGEGERRKRKRAEDLDGGHFSWNSQDTG